MVVGSYWDPTSGTNVVLSETWDGARWTMHSSVDVAGGPSLVAVSCATPSSCLATGGAESGGYPIPGAEWWNGSTWLLLTPQAPIGAQGDPFTAVTCQSAGQCTAVGTQQGSDGVATPFVEEWNGASWTLDSTPDPEVPGGETLNGVACSASECMAVGSRTGTTFALGSDVSVPTGNPYSPLSPTRICDTRPGNPSGLSSNAAQCDGTANAGTTLAAGGTLTIDVGGLFSVPADASAVVLNVTVVNPASVGYLTVYPTGQSRPVASNLNFDPHQAVPNLVEVGLGPSGQVSIYSSSATDVVVDLEGYAAPSSSLGAGAGLYNPLSSPARICDTRAGNPSGLSAGPAQCNGAGNAGSTLAAGATLPVQVAGVGGVPGSGVSAVVLNVTAVGPAGVGYLTVYPAGGSRPTASNVNYVTNQVVPNRVVVPVSGSGQIDLYTSTATDVLVDVSGWYSGAGGAGTSFVPESAPVRICDTRAGNPSGLSGPSAQCNGAGDAGTPIPPSTVLTITAAGYFGVPASAKAVVLNVTAVEPTALTYLTVYPSGSPPGVSDLNPYAGAVEPNLVVATLSNTGTIDIYNNSGTVDVVVDVLGWYS